jgi:hypothetical protein
MIADESLNRIIRVSSWTCSILIGLPVDPVLWWSYLGNSAMVLNISTVECCCWVGSNSSCMRGPRFESQPWSLAIGPSNSSVCASPQSQWVSDGILTLNWHSCFFLHIPLWFIIHNSHPFIHLCSTH